MQKLIELGHCRAPHGIKGAFTFTFANPESRTLENGSQIILEPLSEESSLKGQVTFEIDTITYGNKVICTLKNVDDRNTVEAMVPFRFCVSRDQLEDADLEEGEFFFADLIGLKVVAENNEAFKGVVSEVYENGAQAVIVIKREGESENIELPFVDAFVKEVDLEKGEILANIPEWI